MVETKFGLPVLQRIDLRGFSLYTEKSEIDLEISSGVFCVVGANGLGKSTFIAAVNFGLCGRLPNPSEAFRSSSEYFQRTRTYSSSFFEGRIGEYDRENAEIEIEFTINSDRYHIVRGAFESEELRYMSLNDQEFSRLSGDSPAGINALYKSAIANSVGVSTFEQFVFLQFFIFTFDERRNLTFWETPIQRQILLLAFGEDVGEAQNAENLRRQIERQGSISRNATYQATQTRRKLREAQRIVEGLDPETIELELELERLYLTLDELTNRESEELESLADSKLRTAELRSEALSLKGRIDDVFAQRGARTSDIKARPIVSDSLLTRSCNICGASGDDVINGINERLSQPSCPLCGIDLPTNSTLEDSIIRIGELDEQLVILNKQISEEVEKQQRVQADIDRIQASIASQEMRIAEIEKGNRQITRFLGTSNVSEIQLAIETYQRSIRELNRAKSDALRERDEARAELLEIQDRVSQVYTKVEHRFLRIFKNLAEAFLGMDLDVQFDSRGTDIFLVLLIEGQARRQQHQLSESQRFFVDIALRMAITTFISDGGSGTLLVDTPEGSLDIAYEGRAGEMFAQFVEGGYHIMMTANINTSQLLRVLARRCGTAKMHIERMTEWTTLSEVQIEAEYLFEEAYSQLESDLLLAGA